MRILVTGGTGYIGSHSVVSLCAAGYDVAIIDNLSRSSRSVLGNLETLVGHQIPFVEGDVRDPAALDRAFGTFDAVDCVVHFAAYKSVRESTMFPLRYFDNNVGGLLSLLTAMQRHRCGRIVFSSSCTVYGQPHVLPVTEHSPLGAAASAYGVTKQQCEEILAETFGGNVERESQCAVSLRYFNPAGAHESTMIGEQPLDVPDNLVPFITQTAAGWRDKLQVFGDDYDTADGTAVRDYIHVVDLAEAHVAAVGKAINGEGVHVFNIGTGHGSTVREVINAFIRATGISVPVEIGPRRAGDVGKIWSSCELANRELGWKATRTLEAIMQSAWRWQQTLTQT